MTYAIILSAGNGMRLNHSQIKPLVLINKKPLFLYTVRTFIKQNNIDQVILVIEQQHEASYRQWIKSNKLRLCYGSNQSRCQSLINAIAFLKTNFTLDKNDIILTHDVARINVCGRIINDNIRVAKNVGYASTLIPISDSICEVSDTFKYINRQHKYLVQTPQTFQYKY
jgi:2-C-methyl-D-erythritol 4-phosphate cytidylyltransferase